ncbi:hypothetical protein VTO42DRAFT_3596 [Malbranchea cinnamomea]
MRLVYTRNPTPKRQTRLTFTPIPTSSSPGIEQSPGSITGKNYNTLKSNVVSSSPAATPLKAMTSDSSSDEDDIRAPSSSRRAPKRSAVEINANDNDSDSDEIVISSPVKRRKRAATRLQTSTKDHSESQDSDLAEDLADLQDSDTPVTTSRTRGRIAQSAAKLKRMEQLEALKRRRAGNKDRAKCESPSQKSTEDSASQDFGNSSGKDEPAFEENDSDFESVAKFEDLDEYEDDFVLRDDDSTLGAPAELHELPFEFSRHRYKRLRDHFRDVVEWMVHNKLNPAFPRNDEVYQVAFSKVKNEVTGIAGSQLLSSVWTIDFRRALEARPGIVISSYPISDNHPCDACNRSKHPASYDIRFDGKPYMFETLEPVSDDDSDEDGDEGDKSTSGNVDRNGHDIPDAKKHFYLGRHCKAKATMAHTLIHWRYHLNEWVIDYLRRQGFFTDEKILERERWSLKRRTRYANHIVDMMDEDGEIDRLWRDFNLNVKTARGLQESRW